MAAAPASGEGRLPRCRLSSWRRCCWLQACSLCSAAALPAASVSPQQCAPAAACSYTKAAPVNIHTQPPLCRQAIAWSTKPHALQMHLMRCPAVSQLPSCTTAVHDDPSAARTAARISPMALVPDTVVRHAAMACAFSDRAARHGSACNDSACNDSRPDVLVVINECCAGTVCC